MWSEDVVDCNVKSASEVAYLLPDPLFVTILDPLSDGEQLRQQDHSYPVRDGTAREDDDVVRGSGIEVCNFLSELLEVALNWDSIRERLRRSSPWVVGGSRAANANGREP
jgi:hypothetical protein